MGESRSTCQASAPFCEVGRRRSFTSATLLTVALAINARAGWYRAGLRVRRVAVAGARVLRVRWLQKVTQPTSATNEPSCVRLPRRSDHGDQLVASPAPARAASPRMRQVTPSSILTPSSNRRRLDDGPYPRRPRPRGARPSRPPRASGAPSQRSGMPRARNLATLVDTKRQAIPLSWASVGAQVGCGPMTCALCERGGPSTECAPAR